MVGLIYSSSMDLSSILEQQVLLTHLLLKGEEQPQHRVTPTLGPQPHAHTAHIQPLLMTAFQTAVLGPHAVILEWQWDVGWRIPLLWLGRSCLAKGLRTPGDLPHFWAVWVNVIIQHCFAILLPKPIGSLMPAGSVSKNPPLQTVEHTCSIAICASYLWAENFWTKACIFNWSKSTLEIGKISWK